MATARKIGSDEVAAVSYGTMGLVAFYGTSSTQEHHNKVLSHVIAESKHKPILDTSDVYTNRPSLGAGEEMIGVWLSSTPGAREKSFISTKHVYTVGPEGRGVRGGKDYALEACAASLKRLQIDHIDLYFAHRPTDQIEGTQEGLKQLKEEGKIKYIGVSEYNLEQLERAEKVAHIDSLQIELSPWTPEIVSNGILDWCKKNNVAVLAYSPIGRGFLSGSIKSIDDLEENDWRRGLERFSAENFPKNLKLVDELQAIAKRKGCTAAQISLAWVLAQGDNIIAIPGSTNPERISENIAAEDVKLSAEELKEIDSIIASFKVSGQRYPTAMSQNIAF